MNFVVGRLTHQPPVETGDSQELPGLSDDPAEPELCAGLGGDGAAGYQVTQGGRVQEPDAAGVDLDAPGAFPDRLLDPTLQNPAAEPEGAGLLQGESDCMAGPG